MQCRRQSEGLILDESPATEHLQDRLGGEDIWNRISVLWVKCMRGAGMFVFARLTVGERTAEQGFMGLD